MRAFVILFVSFTLFSCQGILVEEQNEQAIQEGLKDEREESIKQLVEIEALRERIIGHVEHLEGLNPQPIKDIIKGQQIIKSLNKSEDNLRSWIASNSITCLPSDNESAISLCQRELLAINDLNKDGLRSIVDAKAFIITNL